MRIPLDLSGKDLIKLLIKYGYSVTSQKGSHIKITTSQNGEHHLAIPNHNPIKIGTLNGILSQVANHFSVSKIEIMSTLFEL